MAYSPFLRPTSEGWSTHFTDVWANGLPQVEEREMKRPRRCYTRQSSLILPRLQQWANPEIGFARLVEEISTEARTREWADVSNGTSQIDWTETVTFRYTVGAMVVANSVLLGVTANYGNTIWTDRAFAFILGFFAFELIVRVYYRGVTIFSSAWACFDISLVVVGVIDMLVPVDATKPSSVASNTMSMLRVCRIFRILRLFEISKRLNVLWQAFLKALESTLSVFFLVAVMNYSCAVVMTIMVGNKAHEWEEDFDKVFHWFGTVFRSMQTLFSIMTLAQWADVIYTLQGHCAPWKHPIIFLFFAAYIFVAAYALMNMITGILCDTLTAADRQREREWDQKDEHACAVSRKEFAKSVIQCLQRLDLNGDSKISRSEVEQALSGDLVVIEALHALDIDLSQQELLELIQRLSTNEADGEEVVALKEVAGVITNLTGSASAYSVIDLQYTQTRMNQRLDDVCYEIEKLSEGLQQMSFSVDLVGGGAKQKGPKK
eukprot:TRINITY_DN64383_c0_g1_i1.p1 TRINITY_DN64383_c0_g1~~TRINITY_DN64383_c0_g1_i1.p1  ORF type:complete len:491 (+),score=63.10 TRINITY_DN64383_c0_g1_i1:66-1538(+)